MLCGTDNIQWNICSSEYGYYSARYILLVPHNIVMALNNAMTKACVKLCLYLLMCGGSLTI
jgi:hypothetical protein